MTTKITKLTKAQEALLPVWRDKWIKIGLSCEPLDLEKATRSVGRVYRGANLIAPGNIIVCDGPLSGAITASILRRKGASVRASVRNSVWDSVWDSVWASVRDSVRNSVWDSVRDSVWDSVRNSVWDSVWDSVWASVRDSVWDSVWASVRDSVRDSVWASVRDSVRNSVWDSVRDSVWDSVRDQRIGAHDAGWLSFYSYFLHVLRLREARPLSGLISLAQHCGWWAPYSDVAILQHRHSSLHRDSRGRLHNPAGMAVGYRDGWGVYAWHGVRVPAWIIETPKEITPQKIESESNAEIRRVLIERFGFDRFLKEGGLKLIQQDDFGRLYKREYSDSEPAVAMVEVINSTPEPDGSFKKYVIPVRSTVKTAHEAVASSFGLEVRSYNPTLQT